MITFDRVSKRYSGNHDALRGLSFEIDKKEMCFLTGHSGAGKSTLLKLIMLIERASSGKIHIGDIDLDSLRYRHVAEFRRHIGFVFQNHRLLFDRTVLENVALPLQVAGINPIDTRRRAQAALDKVGLGKYQQANPIELSGGEQQRVGIARALVHKPEVLLADEPTGNLDPELSADIMHLFEEFNSLGTTILIATHDIELISSMPYRCLKLENGQLEGANG